MPKVSLFALTCALVLSACGHDKVVIESKAAPADPVVVARPATAVETAGVVETRVELDSGQVAVVRDYYVERQCPAGFARRGGACVAERVVAARYAVGEPLPQGVVGIDLPADLVVKLKPLPEGHVYQIVDGDLVVVRRADLIVLDADDLF